MTPFSRRLILGTLLGLLAGCQDQQYIHVGPNWDNLQKLQPGEDSFQVEVRGGDRYVLGDMITFAVRSKRAGNLWVVQVDPDDDVATLFPNDHERNTAIPANTWVEIPPAGVEWGFQAAKPAGASVFAFIVTTGDVRITDILAQAETGQATTAKAVDIVVDKASWGLAKQVIKVEER